MLDDCSLRAQCVTAMAEACTLVFTMQYLQAGGGAHAAICRLRRTCFVLPRLPLWPSLCQAGVLYAQ